VALEKIIAAKRPAVEQRKRETPLTSFIGSLKPANRSLADALRKSRCGFVMECKQASPSQGLMRSVFDPAAIAAEYSDVADAISVITDEPFFKGRLEYLTLVSQATQLPVVCKDFVVDPYQIYEARRYGADAILLMLSVLDDQTLNECLEVARRLFMDALVEVHDHGELERALTHRIPVLGINNRNLKTLEVTPEVTEQLAQKVPKDVLVISESGIGNHQDVLRLRPLVDGFLVGSSLMKSPDIGRAARELVYGRVKTCGLTTPKDAKAAWRAGATWGGLIFAKESPRCVMRDQARKVRDAASLQWVGVFVDEDLELVARIAWELNLSAVQLHGNENAPLMQRLRKTLAPDCAIWKACRVSDSIPTKEEIGADRLLLDTYEKDRSGGTGKSFDWNLLRSYPQRNEVILAGGLNPSNAAEADSLGVWALDVNSGVEHSPGIKDAALLNDFFAALRG
jgi:indole-3-glycerol phosphate synthase/phosphoribosylanthranilate isomerase